MIGPYRIIRELGRGGMGVVFLAEDPRLDRRVAVKSLPEHMANDPARLARFEREAKVLASLNHPGIAAIYGLEESGGSRYLILEYVEGQTLDERLSHGPLPVDEAIDVAVCIAEAIESAHQKGVIHRDLKPGNIMLTREGGVKVLDFGLARVGEEAGDVLAVAQDSPTLVTPLRSGSPTIPGAVMGTAGYLSPEQARGRPVDKRSDIFSFGCVLFEMLTSQSLFEGETVADSVGATLHKTPDLSSLPASTPGRVVRVLRRSLAKDPRERLHDFADVRIELRDAASDAAQSVSSDDRVGRSRVVVIVGASALLTLGLLAMAMVHLLKPPAQLAGDASGPPPPLPILDAEIRLPGEDRLGHGFAPGLAISRDGQLIAFPVIVEPEESVRPSAGFWGQSREIMIRRLDHSRAVPLAGTGSGSGQPVFSPDGQWVAYVAGEGRNEVFKARVSGSEPIKIATAPAQIVGLAWGDDDEIIIGQLYIGGLLQVSASGGATSPLTTVDREADESSHGLPHVMPGGDVLHVVYGVALGANRTVDTWLHDRASGERKRLIENAAHPHYVRGHVVFVREGDLMVIPYDREAKRTTGSARLIGASVMQAKYVGNVSMMTSAGQFAISPTGTLVMAEGSVPAEPRFSLAWVDRAGVEASIDIERKAYLVARVSPTGGQVILTSAYEPTKAAWIHEFDRGITRRIARTGRIWAIPGPGPDDVTGYFVGQSGKTVFGILAGVSQSARLEALEMPDDDPDIVPAQWTLDGRHLIACGTQPVSPGSRAYTAVFWIYSRGEGWRLLFTPGGSAVVTWPAISPDGRWLAYTVIDQGAMEVFVRPLLEAGPVQQVSVGGGACPAWSHDGREIVYLSHLNPTVGPPRYMSVAVSSTGERLSFARPERLFTDADVGYVQGGPIRTWDLAPDGRFLFVKPPHDEEFREYARVMYADRLRVIQNWAARLER